MKSNFLKKVLLVTVVMCASLSMLAASELRYIQYNQIQNTGSYEDELLFAMNNEDYLSSYMPDEYWRAPYSRAEYVTRLTALYEKLEKYPEPENQDYLLLKGVICTFLYNLDEMDFYSTTIDAYLSVETLPSYDYRYLWFLGNFYTNSMRLNEGVACYEKIFSKISRELLHPDLFLYSAQAYSYAQMPNCAIRDYKMYEKLTGNSVQNITLYQQSLNRLHEYDGTDTDEDNLSAWRTKDGSVGFQSTAYGVWLMPEGDWVVNNISFLEDRFIFMAASPVITTQKDNASYSFLLLSVLSQNPEDADSFKTFNQLAAENNAVCNTSLFPDRDDLTIIEWTDSTKYQAAGGAHCYAALIVRSYSETADCDIEFPYEYPRSEGNTYYVLKDSYKRYNGYVVSLLMFDSCEAINEETKAAFIRVVEESAFY